MSSNEDEHFIFMQHGPSCGHTPTMCSGLCCTLSGPLGTSIAQLVRNTKPDRLIIEPSGLGHPAGGHVAHAYRGTDDFDSCGAGLLDTLQNEHLCKALAIKAIICMVSIETCMALRCSTSIKWPVINQIEYLLTDHHLMKNRRC